MPASQLAPSRARAFVRALITRRALSSSSLDPPTERLADDAALLVDELTTNALIHAGTEMAVVCRVERAPDGNRELTGVRIEVVDRQPSGVVPGGSGSQKGEQGLGLQLVTMLADAWGVTYRRTQKAVWCHLLVSDSDPPPPLSRLPEPAPYRPLGATGPAHPYARVKYYGSAEQTKGVGSFVAEASELLSGQLDENMVAALAGQLMVPRLADWCAVWLLTEGGDMRLASVWHADEGRIPALRRDLEPDPPPHETGSTSTPWPWPESAGSAGNGGSALAFSMTSAGSCQGILLIGRAGPSKITDPVVRTVKDVARRVAQALVMAHQYTYQTSISRAVQRRQLPTSLGSLPGVESAIVYEPHARSQTVGGDFYDLFPTGDGRWCFLLGDVQGKDAEAMSVTGLTRHIVRLLARQGNSVETVLGLLNVVLAEDAAEAASAAGDSARPRFLSMLYGELTPDPNAGGARCTLASAGHPLPLRMSARGRVESVIRSQLLLGIEEDTAYTSNSFHLTPGETLLCVTDGVTERRDGRRQLDDDDGLARIFADCAGMGAMAVAERIRQATHDFSPEPMEDDLALVVLHAVPAAA